MTMRLFLSSVTDREASDSQTPDPLRTWLDGQLRHINTPCVYQEFLIERGVNTLEKLAMAIHESSDMVVHVLGEEGGCCPPETFAQELFRYCSRTMPTFEQRFPYLFEIDGQHNCIRWMRLTYSQWEAWLAKYFDKQLLIIAMEACGKRNATNVTQIMSNQEHLQLLEQIGGRPRQCNSFQDVLSAIKDALVTSLQTRQQHRAPRDSWPETIVPSTSRIADRHDEVDCFLELVSNHCGQKIMMLKGPSNRGKSTLLQELRRIAMEFQSIVVASANLKGGVTLPEVLNCISQELAGSIQFPRYKQALEHNPRAIDQAIIEDIVAAGTPTVIFIDTFEEAARDCRQWIESQLLPFVIRHNAVRVVITGHRVPDPPERWNNWIRVQELLPICEAVHWCRYRDTLGVESPSDALIQQFVVKANGDPLAMDALIRVYRNETVV
jgi:predicted ATPase